MGTAIRYQILQFRSGEVAEAAIGFYVQPGESDIEGQGRFLLVTVDRAGKVRRSLHETLHAAEQAVTPLRARDDLA